jgi:hypothetical protein
VRNAYDVQRDAFDVTGSPALLDRLIIGRTAIALYAAIVAHVAL